MVLNFFLDLYDRVIMCVRHCIERKKFKDKRRIEIYSSINLSAEQKKSIDGFFKENYGKKIPYIWHRHFTAYTGKFDVAYFPELLYIPEFEYFMNGRKGFAEVFSDKNMLPILAKSVGVKMPKTVVSSTSGVYRDGDNRFITLEKLLGILKDSNKVFIKPSVDSNSGEKCRVIEFKDGMDMQTGKSCDEILKEYGKDFVVQECLTCHASIATIYPNSVNTFRVITYRWRDKIYSMPVIMRIGQGGASIDNAHAGGMFIAIDDDGTLHEAAFTEFREVYTHHPDTGIRFEKYRIDKVPQVIEKAKILHAAIPQYGCINWDFTIDAHGDPILIEANMTGGSIWLIEMAHGHGAFGDNTAEILQWMRFMKKIPFHKRQRYMYGNMQF